MRTARIIAFLCLVVSFVSCGGGGGGSDPVVIKYSVGGTLSGLSGTGFVLQNNGADDLSVAADGSFTFAATLANGASYSVGVSTQPLNQSCLVTNGTGTINAANVTGVTIACHNNEISGTVTISTEDLLKVASSTSSIVGHSELGLIFTGTGSGYGGVGVGDTGTPVDNPSDIVTPLDSSSSYSNVADLSSTVLVSMSYSGTDTLDACSVNDPLSALTCAPADNMSITRQSLSDAMSVNLTASISISLEKDNYPAIVSNGLSATKYLITQVSNFRNGANDFYEGVVNDGCSFTEYNGELYFSAYNESGTTPFLNKFTGTEIVQVTNDNTSVSYPSHIAVSATGGPTEKLYFSANEGLFQYDGSTVTRLTNDTSMWPIYEVFAYGNDVLFVAADILGAGAYRIFRYDGSNINVVSAMNSSSDVTSYPFFKSFNGLLYFSGYNASSSTRLFATDISSIEKISDINSATMFNDDPKFMTVMGNSLYFSARDTNNYQKLYRYNGTEIAQITNLYVAGTDYPQELTVYDNVLYFTACSDINACKLYRYDGANLVKMTNFRGDVSQDGVSHLIVFNNELYFNAYDSDNNFRIFKYDGTRFLQISNIYSGGDEMYDSYVYNNALYFVAKNSDGYLKLFKLE